MDDKERGLYEKYTVTRTDGNPKHDGCKYFVLDLIHDEYALPAIAAYAMACRKIRPQLAAELADIATYGLQEKK